MKRICAWCGCDLSQGPWRPDAVVTHGVCHTCRVRVFAPGRPQPGQEQPEEEPEEDDAVPAAGTHPAPGVNRS